MHKNRKGNGIMEFKDKAAVDLLIKNIMDAVDKKYSQLYYDKTFPAVVYGKDENGKYLIPFEGRLRPVASGLTEELKEGQWVWVKIPNGKLREMHICNIRR